MMNIKTLAVPAFVAMSLIFTACAGNQQIEAPDAVDGAVQDGIEGIEEGAGNAGDAINGGLENLKDGADNATGAIEDGAKDLGKDIEGAAGAAKDGINRGIEDAGNAVNELGNEVPSDEAEVEVE